MKTFKEADILLPGKEVNMEKWSVIACDQFTVSRNIGKR